MRHAKAAGNFAKTLLNDIGGWPYVYTLSLWCVVIFSVVRGDVLSALLALVLIELRKRNE